MFINLLCTPDTTTWLGRYTTKAEAKAAALAWAADHPGEYDPDECFVVTLDGDVTELSRDESDEL